MSVRADSLAAAIADGLPVFPLQGKVPFKGSKGSKDATTNPGQIEYWQGAHPGCNWGIATGHELPSGGFLVVIDIDGDEGKERLAKGIENYGDLPATFTVRTSRGMHYYFRSSEPLPNRAAGGLDVRGVGGYVVAPGSVHPDTGAMYQVVARGKTAALPAQWEVGLARERMREKQQTVDPAIAIPEGQRNTYAYKQACALIDRGLGHAAVEAALKADTRLTLSDEEIEKAVGSAFNAGYTPENSIVDEVRHLAGIENILDDLDTKVKEDAGYIFRPEIVAALTEAREEGGAQWARCVDIMRKRRVMIRSINAKMDEHAERLKPTVSPNEHWDDEPIALTIPGDWRSRAEGVFRVGKEGAEIRVLSCPLLVTRRLKTIDTLEEKLEITWRRDGSWTRHICDRSIVASASSIIALADQGLPVTSTHAKEIVAYLEALEASNMEVIPLELATERTGWLGDGRFYPGAAGDVSFAPPGWAMTNMFNPSGTLEEWVGAVDPLRAKYPLLRLQVAASFAAPLLHRIGHRNFILHLWGSSRSGKTAVLRAAASVWGSRSMVVQFSGTQLGLQNHAAMLADLPMCINERQIAGGKSLDNLLYALAEGVGKVQGARGGGNRDYKMWRTIVLTNGEEPMHETSSTQGVRTRTLEIEGQPITDEQDAVALYEALESQHGTAGAKYIEALASMPTGKLGECLLHVREQLKVARTDQIMPHMEMCAVICLADWLAEAWVFGREWQEAGRVAIANMQALIATHIEGDRDVDQGASAYEWVCSWVAQHRDFFAATKADRPAGSRDWGWWDGKEVWINQGALSDAMYDAKLSYRASLRAIAEQNLLRTRPDGNKTRFDIRRNGSRFIVVDIPDRGVFGDSGQATGHAGGQGFLG